MTHIAYREFEVTGGKHVFGYGEVRYTFTIDPGRASRTWANATEGFAPAEDATVDVLKIEVRLAPSQSWWAADRTLLDMLCEVPVAWFLAQVEDADE